MTTNKLKEITPSYTIEISTKVSELKQQGKKVIDLSIGEPDFNIPNTAKQAAINAIHQNKTKYDKVPGLFDLREAIIKKLKEENNISYEISDIVVSNGAKHAITNALIALLNPGDEVLIPVPYWVSYPEMVKLTGGVPVFLEATRESDYRITPEIIESNLSEKTKMIFITNPSNPSGTVYSRVELQKIVDVCVKHNIYILADEIYERICFDGEFTSIASLSPLAKDITVTINGMSKSFAMTGMRIGYSASNKEIAKAISIIQGHLISHPSTISQWSAAAALKESRQDVESMRKEYMNRRDMIITHLDKIPKLSYVYPKGAFYVFIDISQFKDYIDFSDSYSVAFSNKLLEEGMVAVVPGIAFGMDNFIRISYACNMDFLTEGLNKLKDFLSKLAN